MKFQCRSLSDKDKQTAEALLNVRQKVNNSLLFPLFYISVTICSMAAGEQEVG